LIFRGFITESVSVTYCIQLGTGQGILLNDNVLNVWEISKLLTKKGMLLTHNAWQKVNNIQLSPEREVNNCFSKIQLVGQKNIKAKHLSQVKARFESFFTAKTLQI